MNIDPRALAYLVAASHKRPQSVLRVTHQKGG